MVFESSRKFLSFCIYRVFFLTGPPLKSLSTNWTPPKKLKSKLDPPIVQATANMWRGQV